MSAIAEPMAALHAIPASRRAKPLWLSLLSFCLWRGLAVGLVFSMILAGGAAVFAAAQARHATRSRFRPQAEVGPRTFSGMITDSNCGARHNKNSNLSSTECAQACIRGGAKYVLVDGERVLYLEGHPRQFEKLAGQRVEVRGTREGETIQVDSIQPQ